MVRMDWNKARTEAVTLASDLGWRAGAPIPDTLVADGTCFTKRTREVDNDGDLVCTNYRDDRGRTIKVFND